jgi:hypothetical protein
MVAPSREVNQAIGPEQALRLSPREHHLARRIFYDPPQQLRSLSLELFAQIRLGNFEILARILLAMLMNQL